VERFNSRALYNLVDDRRIYLQPTNLLLAIFVRYQKYQDDSEVPGRGSNSRSRVMHADQPTANHAANLD